MTDQPEKFDLTSGDIVGEKLQELLKIFPEVRTEGGKIDFERLKAVLGTKVDVGKERYGLNWPGKADCLKTIQQPSLGTLLPCPAESVNFDTTENLFIEGDNLEVLKLLQKSYPGKVKMIYIDPPYNTGNDFIYPDNFNESLQTYLEYTGQVDAEGKKFGSNSERDGRFHSKWLNMMYPRLYLAKNLLREDGVIFISIDDHEVDNLKKLCNEIFGEENFIESIIWKKRSTPPNDKILGANHDYILVFAKNQDFVKLNLRKRSEEQVGRYKNPDKHPKGVWTPGDLMANVKGGRYVASLYFPIKNPNTGEEHYPGDGGNWRFNRKKIELLQSNNEIYFGEDGKGRPKLKRFLTDVKEGVTWPTIWDFVPLNTQGSEEMSQIFGNMTIFENPKPSGLLVEFFRLGSEPGDIILDFFSGSGTTADSILHLNNKKDTDSGNRKFILVQLPEPCDPESAAFKAGFKTIADICKERIRRAIKKLNEADAAKPNVSSSVQDRGFRVFKLAESNFKTWDAQGAHDAAELEKQLEMHIIHIRAERSPDDILSEIILKSGFPLTVPIVKLDLAGKTVFNIAGGALFICLEHELTLPLIRAIAEKKPARVVCLDAGFAGNDQLKTNAVLIFKNKGVTSFKTI
jgi:adenine-specific DNA-methyltransferase